MNKQFAEMCRKYKIDCDDEVMALGYMMRDWLQAAIIDSGTNVDQGAGIGNFDLWAKVGGKDIFINIKLK